MQTNVLHLKFSVNFQFSEIRYLIIEKSSRNPKFSPKLLIHRNRYLCLNHKTATHSHFINHSKYIHVWFIFIILKKFIDSDKCSSSSDTCRAMNYCRAHCWKSIHFMTNLSNKTNKGIQWRWNSIIRPHSKMELKDKVEFGTCLS